jgi:hypothetical protein
MSRQISFTQSLKAKEFRKKPHSRRREFIASLPSLPH